INRPVWYVPYAQLDNSLPVNLVIRTDGDPTNATTAVRNAIRSLDPDQPISKVMTMDANLSRVLVTERFSAGLMSVSAALGLMLAALGLYGVMAYSVIRRTSEIGLRMALGARPRDIFILVIGGGAKLIAAGLILGLTGASALTHLLSGVLYEVGSNDPVTFSVIAMLLAAVMTAACYIPARRAMRVDPLAALRYE